MREEDASGGNVYLVYSFFELTWCLVVSHQLDNEGCAALLKFELRAMLILCISFMSVFPSP